MATDSSISRLCIFGCGYVGMEVARRALERGWQVTALTRNIKKAASLREMGVAQVVTADLDSDSWHADIDSHQDFVLNAVSSAGGGLEGYRKSYINGQRSLLDWAARGRIGTLVYTSATSVYPQSDGQWVDEDTSNEGASPTGQLLLEAEQLLPEASSSVARTFILRLGGIYGPDRHYLLNKLRAGENQFSGSGDSWLNLIHRDDIATAVETCFAAPAGIGNRTYNLTDGNPAMRGEIIGWLAEQIGAPPPVFEASLSGKRDSGRRSANGNLPNRRIVIDRIKAELGWKPTYPSYRKGFTQLLQ